MKVAVLSIGTELTRGELTNSNASWLSAELTRAGFDVIEGVTVDDDRDRIKDAMRGLVARGSGIIVSTGGLGPTTDDLTTETIADLVGAPLVRDEPSLEAIRARFRRFNREMSASNAKQADFPRGADILPNAQGTAPGFGISVQGARAFFMPGVPCEMKAMFEHEVLPRIQMHAEHTSHQIHLRTFGLPESQVGERLAGVEAQFPGLILGYRAHFPEIEVKMFVRAQTHEQARQIAEAATAVVREKLGDIVFGGGGDSFAGVVLRALQKSQLRVGIGESCTGGLVGHLLTALPGASDVLLADIVAYANTAKVALLGVPQALIDTHGAVSPEVALAMAEGARRVSGADIGLGITGIAGPSGGTDEKPVGTVFLAAVSGGKVVTRQQTFKWDRERIQIHAAYSGLSMLRELSGS